MIFDTKGEQLLLTLMNYQIAILSVARFTETAALLETIQQARTNIQFFFGSGLKKEETKATTYDTYFQPSNR